MALVLKDRVKEVTSVTSTGTATLLGAVVGFQSFNTAIPTGSTVYYCIAGQGTSEWEVGIGTFTAPNQLSRDTVYSSSSAGALVNFSAGTKDVFVTYPSERAVFEEADGTTVLRQGPITVVGANVTSYTSFGASLGEFYANTPGFAQLYAQNLSGASNASTDIVAYNNLGDGTNKFIDMGICSSAYTEAAFPIFSPNSGYVYNDGGTLLVGSATNNVTVFAGGVNVNSAVVTFNTDSSTSFKGNVAIPGTFTSNGAATFGSTVLLNADPTLALQASTKQYVDSAVSTGFIVHDSAVYATAAALPNSPTYNNGTSGVGATLTANANAALVIDGVTLVSPTDNGIRVLIKNQVSSQYNGIYDVTEAGSGSAPWVLTRATDFDTYVAGNISTNAYIYITSGSTNIGSSWIFSQVGTVTVGTTPLHFELFSQPADYTGTSPINVTGQTISLTGTVAATNGGTGANTVATGDLLYGSATDTWSKLPIGAGYKSLRVNAGGTQVEWNSVALDQSAAISGSLGPTNGGTGISSYTQGDMLYANNTNSLDKVTGNITTTKKFLGQTGTGSAAQAPVWEQPAASDITGLAPSATTDTSNASNITSGTLPTGRLTGSYTGITGVGTIAAGDWAANAIAVSYGGTGASNTTDARTNLGLTIGTNVQAYSATLQTVANLSSNGLLNRSAANTVSIASAADIVSQIGSTAVTNATNATTATTATTANGLNTGNSYTAIGYVLNAVGAERSYAWNFTGKSVNLFGRDSDDAIGIYDTGTGQVRCTFDVSGNFVAAGNVTAYSDERLKKNWANLSPTFLEDLAKVKYGTYTRIDSGERQVGVSAQDMQKILPEVVQDGEHLSLAYGNAALVAAIELAKQVVELKKEIELLKAR